jgi:hypothetical protein
MVAPAGLATPVKGGRYHQGDLSDEAAAEALAEALEAAAHGHAALLLNGDYGEGPEAVGAAADKAARATLALIAGRSALG